MSERRKRPYDRTERYHAIDRDLPAKGFVKAARIDLGLALLHARRKPGETYTQLEIAQWAGCSPSLIHEITKGALAKIARRYRELKEER